MFKKSGNPEKRARGRKAAFILLSLVLLVSLAAGGTLAYLREEAAPVTNTFEPGSVSVEIIEQNANNAKTSVLIKNTGASHAYLRVAVVANHVNAEGQIIAGEEITIPYSDKWKYLDGYYYYKGVAAPGEAVEFLKSPLDYNGKEINIMAQAIQSAGGFVNDKWKHDFDGSQWT